MPAPPRHVRAGFTLHEVLIVVVMIGILAAIGAPRFDLSGHRSETAIQSVSSTLMAAQRAAVARQHDVVVAIDVDARRLRIHHDADNDGVVDPAEDVRSASLPDGVVFGRGAAPVLPRLGAGPVTFTRRQGTLPVVVFTRGGHASEEGGLYLTSARAAAEGNRVHAARAVVVERASGRPSVFRLRGGAWEARF